jgi:general nucleoside transport system ATP-binding protein
MSYIEFRNIRKQYGDCISCNDVSISIEKGHVHAIIGENGAGKSTLVKMLGGVTPPTSGEMFLNGKSYAPSSPQNAFEHKIAFIHQHFVLAEQLTALDNLYLSYTASQFSLHTKKLAEVKKLATDLIQKFNWQINLDLPVKDISVGEQQRLEILKALLQQPDIIIFDEPTAVLTPQESEDLLKFILQLKSEGKTILIISHKLNEIKAVSDKVSVLRQGQHIATKNNSDLSIENMAELMIGRRPQQATSPLTNSTPKSLLNIPKSQLSLNKSEILGVAGIEGNGQSQLISILLEEFKKLNLNYGDITEDRLKLTVFDEFNLPDHMLLKHADKFTQKGLVNYAAVEKATTELVQKWDVRPSTELKKPLSQFSGGNQQKFVVGRELWNNPDVLLAAHPTRGVDLGAQEMIHKSILDFSRQDKSVVLISSDLTEVLTLSDRYVILNKNKIYGPFTKNQLDEKQIGVIMAAQNISSEVSMAGEL